MQRNYVEETAVITEELIAEYKSYLYKEEKSRNTVSKYIRDIRRFSFYGRRAGQKRKYSGMEGKTAGHPQPGQHKFHVGCSKWLF